MYSIWVIQRPPKYEKLIKRLSTQVINTPKIGKINIYNYINKMDKSVNSVISKGKFSPEKSVPIRVVTTKIDSRNLLNITNIKKSLKILSKYKSYLLLVINNNTDSENNNINTLRYYGIGAQIIKDLNVKNMILISRSRKKIIGLEGFGLKIKKQIIIK